METREIKVAEDIASLKVEVKNIKDKQDIHHKELLEEFKCLRAKVNDEITTMQVNIKTTKDETFKRITANRQFYIKILILTLAIGSVIWIKESRDWILANIFRVV